MAVVGTDSAEPVLFGRGHGFVAESGEAAKLEGEIGIEWNVAFVTA